MWILKRGLVELSLSWPPPPPSLPRPLLLLKSRFTPVTSPLEHSQVLTTSTTSILSSPTSPLQQDAILAARAAFHQLPNGHVLFQQCLASPSPIRDVIDALEKRQAAQKSKKHSRFLTKFQQYTQWLSNFSRVIDVVVQTNAGIGCPIWAPIKFVLEVVPLGSPQALLTSHSYHNTTLKWLGSSRISLTFSSQDSHA